MWAPCGQKWPGNLYSVTCSIGQVRMFAISYVTYSVVCGRIKTTHDVTENYGVGGSIPPLGTTSQAPKKIKKNQPRQTLK